MENHAGPWTCFHCGYSTEVLREAAAHFGDRDEELPICRTWKQLNAAERLQEYQALTMELAGERAENERLREELAELRMLLHI